MVINWTHIFATNVFQLCSDRYTPRPLECDPGYHAAVPGAVSVECMGAAWTVQGQSSKEVHELCLATCAVPCQHEGKCVKPNVCECTQDYHGASCETRKCPDEGPLVEHGEINLRLDKFQLQCQIYMNKDLRINWILILID